MIHAGRNIKGARVNVLGLTFKENVPDIRNSKVVDIIRELNEFGVETFVHDPLVERRRGAARVRHQAVRLGQLPAADALILAVPHKQFLAIPQAQLLQKIVRQGCVVDVKSAARRRGAAPRRGARMAAVVQPARQASAAPAARRCASGCFADSAAQPRWVVEAFAA